MKKSIIMLAAVASLFMFQSCKKVVGEGPIQSEIRSISDFSGVASGIGGTITYRIDPEFKVEIIAQRNILDVIETTKENGHLLIKVKNGISIKTNENIIVNISAPSADYLHLSGSGDLTVIGDIISENLDMNISGSGSMNVPKITLMDKIKAVVSGSGDIFILNGTAKNEDLRISGSGKIIMDNVAAEKGIATISGSGNMKVNLTSTLNATISGSGSVYYRGTPQITTHISGSGKVLPL